MIRRALLCVALISLLALAVAGCGGDDDGGDSSSDSPAALLDRAAGKPIESADVRLRTTAEIPGFPVLGDNLSITASGPIAARGSELPELDWSVLLRAGGQSFPASLYAVDGRAYVDFQGLTYEADRELLDMLPLDHQTGQRGKGSMSLRSLGIDPSRWLRKLQVNDGEDIGGDSTRLITGTVDEQAVLADATKAAESPQVKERIEDARGADGLPRLDAESLDGVADLVDDVRVEVNVDDEGYARRVFATLDFKMPKGIEDAAFDGGTIGFEMVIEEIGATVDVQAPANPRPLSDLFDFAGVIFGIEKPSDFWTVPR